MKTITKKTIKKPNKTKKLLNYVIIKNNIDYFHTYQRNN